MPQEKKFLAAGLLILTILIVIFLASGISGVEFQPGTLIALDRGQSEFVAPRFPTLSMSFLDYLLLFILWVVLPLSIVLFIKYPKIRKRILKGLGYFVIYGVILFLVGRKTQETSTEFIEAEQELVDTTIIETQRVAAEFIASIGEADTNLKIILDIAILILIGVLVMYLYRRFFHKHPSTTDQLKTEVESAITEIETGVDIRNVIVRCYVDMSHILMDRRGIQRQETMTTREFELELQGIGLPYPEVQRLTRLFEAVRYGNATINSESERDAFKCLTAIAEAC